MNCRPIEPFAFSTPTDADAPSSTVESPPFVSWYWAPGDRRRRGRRGHAGAAVRARGGSPPGHRRAGLDLRRVEDGGVIWAGVLVASVACYGLKLAGLSLPQRWRQDTRVQRTVPLIPVALLAALVATQTFSTGQHLVLDVRAAALGVALIAVLLRAPFLVVVLAGAATAALLRLI